MKRISHKRSNFAELERDVAEILSKEVCDNHESCDQLRKESADLTERWEELERRLQVGTEDLIEKVLLLRGTLRVNVLHIPFNTLCASSYLTLCVLHSI